MIFIVRYTLPNIFKCEGKRFYPGINNVTEEEWEAIKKHPLLKYRFDQGHLVWIDGKSPEDMEKKMAAKAKNPDAAAQVEPKQEEEENSLAGLNGKAAIEIVKETYDLNLLEKWQSKEERKGVVSAIEDQIEKLTAPPEAEKK